MKIQLLTEDLIFTEYPRNEVDIKMTDESIKTYYVDNRKITSTQNSLEEIAKDIEKLVSKTNDIETAFIYRVENKAERNLIKQIKFD